MLAVLVVHIVADGAGFLYIIVSPRISRLYASLGRTALTFANAAPPVLTGVEAALGLYLEA